ncbi:MAG TPA: ABC transporter ATP-binding protein [Acidimicrobiia bacterium]|nr:ABC transporter ATP-binding protein [Acidimicrobiia bacterium]
MNDPAPLLSVAGLTVEFAGADGWQAVVEDVGFDVGSGEIVAIVGESGSGKSVTSLAIMRLLPPRSSRVRADAITCAGRDLLTLDERAMRDVRGGEIAMIFQEPMTSLNPAFTVGNQIAEAVRTHQKLPRGRAQARAIEMLDRVGIPDPHRRVKSYPHEFSGGMRQRAMIAMALSCNPKLLIADEPTTALDVTIQAQILELLKELQRDFGMAVIFVTHDLGVVADIADRVVVMYAGQVVERAGVESLYGRPMHPYSDGLLGAMPQVAELGRPLSVIPGVVPAPGEIVHGCRFAARCSYAEERCRTSDIALASSPNAGEARCIRSSELALTGTRWSTAHAERDARAVVERASANGTQQLRVHDLSKVFPVHSSFLRRVVGRVRAVDGVSFELARGETLGLVGESGSGKSTVARLVLRLVEPTTGVVEHEGRDLVQLEPAALRAARRDMQIVFQDPYSSLDPRATIAATIGEPLEVHLGLGKAEREARVAALLEQVGLDRQYMRRYPHEFSGGQRQRIAIARALALDPSLLICDEPVSSLDVSTQSQVINLLTDLQRARNLSLLFIAHDLSVVRHISDRIAVMYLGRIVEIGGAHEVYTAPKHPYTEALLSAIPIPEPVEQRTRQRIVLTGDVPSPLNVPSGCRFHTRCPYAMDICARFDPPAFTASDGSTVFCHLHTSGPTLGGRTVAAVEPVAQNP